MTEREKLPPEATVVSAFGWVVITGAAMAAPLLELELELLEEDELLELDDELELDEELLEELLLDDELLEELLVLLLPSPPPQAVKSRQDSMTVQSVVRRATGIISAKG